LQPSPGLGEAGVFAKCVSQAFKVNTKYRLTSDCDQYARCAFILTADAKR
jgi:hypothetical protein